MTSELRNDVWFIYTVFLHSLFGSLSIKSFISDDLFDFLSKNYILDNNKNWKISALNPPGFYEDKSIIEFHFINKEALSATINIICYYDNDNNIILKFYNKTNEKEYSSIYLLDKNLKIFDKYEMLRFFLEDNINEILTLSFDDSCNICNYTYKSCVIS
jgi:hypothetical protein